MTERSGYESGQSEHTQVRSVWCTDVRSSSTRQWVRSARRPSRPCSSSRVEVRTAPHRRLPHLLVPVAHGQSAYFGSMAKPGPSARKRQGPVIPMTGLSRKTAHLAAMQPSLAACSDLSSTENGWTRAGSGEHPVGSAGEGVARAPGFRYPLAADPDPQLGGAPRKQPAGSAVADLPHLDRSVPIRRGAADQQASRVTVVPTAVPTAARYVFE
jgi:hypothetical protein